MRGCTRALLPRVIAEGIPICLGASPLSSLTLFSCLSFPPCLSLSVYLWCRGTVGVLLVGWVVGGLTLQGRYLAKTAGKTSELREEQESWIVAESAP